MRELSLFSGAGGGLLGSKILGWKAVGYVECEPYCQKVLKQRIADGILDAAPIFGDIRKFISEGYADAYQGMVDIVTGGFPCQPFSVAGKGLAENDSRNMWPQARDVIQVVKPRQVLLENVPGIQGYLRMVIRDLRRLGYKVKKPLSLSAGETGSVCAGERIWTFAFKANSAMLESVDIPENIKFDTEESLRRQFARAISSMLSQDDYSAIKRNSDEVARGMDRLKAIGNGQDPLCMAYAYAKLSEGIVERE